MSVEELAEPLGIRVHRGRINRGRCWLILGGVLLSPACGTPDEDAVEILAPVTKRRSVGNP